MDTEYSLDFQVFSVPEPASITGLGLLALATMMLADAHSKRILSKTL